MASVAILTRVSTVDQSTDRQVTELTQYAADRGWEVVQVVQENISGATSNAKRTGLQTILGLARKKKISKVLVLEVSRLGRNTAQVLELLEDLHKLRVSVVVKNYNLETLDEHGAKNSAAQFLLTLLTDISRMERDSLIERVKSGMAEAKRKGKHVGRPAGTNSDLLKEYKEVVKYLAGHSIRETARLAEVSVSTVQRVKKALGTGKEAK